MTSCVLFAMPLSRRRGIFLREDSISAASLPWIEEIQGPHTKRKFKYGKERNLAGDSNLGWKGAEKYGFQIAWPIPDSQRRYGLMKTPNAAGWSKPEIVLTVRVAVSITETVLSFTFAT
jgi:hypothetical protein